MKKIILAAICIMALMIFGCAAPEVGKTKIGVLAPLTGNAAELGSHIQTGADLANEHLGNKYKLVYEDDMCVNTEATISAAQKFMTIDKIELVIGPLCAPPYQAVAGLFNQNEVGFMHTSGITPPFIETSGEFGIPGLSTTIYEEDAFLADFIYNELELKKMGVFVWNEEWAIEHRAGFVKRFEELGGEIVFDEKFNLDETDFRTSILKLQESGAEGVFIVALNFQNADIVKQFKELDAEMKIFGQFEIEDTAFLEPAGEAAEDVMYVYPKIYSELPEVQKFQSEYMAEYGKEPNYYAYIGYDSLMMYDWAIDLCGSVDAACIMDKIRTAKDYPGVSGKMTFNPDKTLSREFEIKTIKEGKFVSY